MCFSATASFTAASLLVPVGIYCAKKARRLHRPYWAIALLPALFGVQQALEGMVWWALDAQDPSLTRGAALGFMAFSHLFWLLWIPVSSHVLEPAGARKTALLALSVFGGLYGASMYLPVLLHEDWLTVSLVQQSISYEATLIYDGYLPRIVVRVLYALIVMAALLISSDRYLRQFGLLIAVSVAVATAFFGYAFISVWCYFAAVLSLFIVYMVLRIDGDERRISSA